MRIRDGVQTCALPIFPLACPHLLCFAAIMPVRTLFATNFYEADFGTPDLLAELEESSRLFAVADGDGRRWSRVHGYKGYTSYAGIADLRSEARRVGEGWVRTCRSRWWTCD